MITRTIVGPYAQRGQIRLGKHTLHYEDPGIAVLVYDGPMTVDEMQLLCDVPDVEEHENQFQLTVCDMTKFGGLDSSARKVGAQRQRPAAIYYTAYVNASFTMQVIVSMWNRAANILQGPKNASGFFHDMEAAKAWLIEKRRAHLDAASNKPRHSRPPPAP